MKITIVGGGEIGRTLCNLLSDEGHRIILIEKDSSFAKDIAAHTNAMIIQGDGTEITSMEEAKVGDSDVLIAATNDDKTNLMVAEIGKSFEIQRIIARVNSVKNEELFTQLAGMDVIPVVGLTVSHIKNLLEHEMLIISSITVGKLNVIRLGLFSDLFLLKKIIKLNGNVSNIINHHLPIIHKKHFVRIVYQRLQIR